MKKDVLMTLMIFAFWIILIALLLYSDHLERIDNNPLIMKVIEKCEDNTSCVEEYRKLYRF